MHDSSLSWSDGPSITRRAIGLYFGLALLYFVGAFLPDRQIGGTDYFIGGYYFLEFAARRLHEGSFPKWVPDIFGGLPMYSNPGGLFYPLRLLLSFILPVARVMPALFVVQFTLAGVGMHLLVRALGVRHWVAIVAGVAFEFTGVVISYVFAGHDGRIIVATLAPLVFFFLVRGVRSGERRWFVGLAATVGLSLLSMQIQSAYYLLLSAALWTLFLLVRQWRMAGGAASVRRAVLALVAVGFAFALAAVNFLPFSSYVKDSPRSATANRDFEFSTQFSMPLVETIGLAVPEQSGFLETYQGDNPFKLHTEYVGAVVLLLVVVGVVLSRRDRVWQFMAALAVLMLSICYGSNTPVYALYYRFLPGTSKFRSPSIALYLVSLALVVMAALALERLASFLDAPRAEDGGPSRRSGILPLTICAAASMIVLLVAGGVALDGSTRAAGWARFALCFYIGAFTLRAMLRGTLNVRAAAMILVAVTAGDLLTIDRHFIRMQAPPTRAFAEDDVVKYLRTHTPGRVWVFPFPDQPKAPHYLGNGLFGPRSDYLMHFGIMQAGGEHGNQLYRWNQLVGIGKGGNLLDWHNFVEYPAIMEAAGIRYIVSGVRLQLYDVKLKTGIRGIRQAYRGSAFIYVDDRALSRATLVPSVRAAPADSALAIMRGGDWDPHTLALVDAPAAPFANPDSLPANPGTTQIDRDEPDHIQVSVRATAPALLVLADNYADGWVATVDGRETPILRTNHTFRGVPVTAGNHTVVFMFKPPLFYAGLAISLVTAIILIIGIVFVVRAYRPHPRPVLAPA
jgi:hypothetical protein